jgi:hypothetical protein
MMRADVRPDYVAIAPAGGIAPTRGDDTPVSQVFAPNGRLRYLVRPAADATPAATCAAFVAPAGAPARAIDPRFVTLAPSGVCRLEADVRALMQQPGDYTITLIVGGTPDGSARAPWPGWRTDDARILSAPVTLQIEEKP